MVGPSIEITVAAPTAGAPHIGTRQVWLATAYDLVGYEIWAVATGRPLGEWMEIFSVEEETVDVSDATGIIRTEVHRFVSVLATDGRRFRYGLMPGGQVFRNPWTVEGAPMAPAGGTVGDPRPDPQGEQCLLMKVVQDQFGNRRQTVCILPKYHGGDHRLAQLGSDEYSTRLNQPGHLGYSITSSRHMTEDTDEDRRDQG